MNAKSIHWIELKEEIMKRYRNEKTIQLFLLIALFAGYIFASVSVQASNFCPQCGYVFTDQEESIIEESSLGWERPECLNCKFQQDLSSVKFSVIGKEWPLLTAKPAIKGLPRANYPDNLAL